MEPHTGGMIIAHAVFGRDLLPVDLLSYSTVSIVHETVWLQHMPLTCLVSICLITEYRNETFSLSVGMMSTDLEMID
jgi:hypothetical protein